MIRQETVDEPHLASVELDHSVFVARSEWLPEPPKDPDWMRRISQGRWEVGLAVAAQIGLFVLLIAGILLILLEAQGGHGHLRHFGVAFILLLAIIVGKLKVVLTHFRHRAQARRAAPCLLELIDLPAVCPQFPVAVSHRFKFGHQTVQYGQDMGIVSFVDGYMHFQGRRTSWSLTRDDLGRPRWKTRRYFQQKGLMRLLKQASYHEVNWRNAENQFQMYIAPMDQMEGLGTDLCEGFRKAANRWLRYPIPQAAPHSLPPATPMPGVVRRKLATYRVLCGLLWVPKVALGSFVAYAVVVSSMHWALFPAFFLALGCLVLGLPKIFARRSLEAVNSLARPEERIAIELGDPRWWKKVNLRVD